MQHGLHHLHLRKRQHVLATYPHPSPWVRLLDKILIFVAVIGPLMAIPQLWTIVSTKSAQGVSPVTWGAFALLNLPWLLYGAVHKERPIILAYSLWFLVNSSVAFAALIYG